MDVIKLIEDLGGTSAVADLCGVKAPSVSGWKETGRIPDDKLIRLAPIAESRGVSTRKELFPNDWQDIWPELAQAQAEPAQAAIKTVANGARAAIEQLEKQAEKTLQQVAEKILAHGAAQPAQADADPLPPIELGLPPIAFPDSPPAGDEPLPDDDASGE